MKKIINYKDLEMFAYSNDKHCKGKIKGIVISFRGLGAAQMISDDTTIEALKPTVARAMRYAENNIAFFVPYTNPWSWMNEEAVSYTDEVIDALISHYSLPNDIPIVSTGGSMGGQCALTYMVYAKRTPVACIANCPVCDVPFHFTERPDLPRSFYSAYHNCEMSMDEALRAHSPLHLADKMPRADYCIFHCEEDRAVNIHAHSERFVAELSKYQNVRYHTVPNRGHCALTPEMQKLFDEYAEKAILG